MYAICKYIQDGKVVCVETFKIKHFDTDHFDSKKKYKVQYDDGHYYKAYIVCLGETEEEAWALSHERRFRMPSVKFVVGDSDENSTTGAEDADAIIEEEIAHKDSRHLKGNKNIKKNIENHNFDQMLSKGRIYNEQTNQNQEIIALQNQISELTKENKALRILNISLQQDVIKKFTDFTTKIVQTNVENLKELKIGDRQNGQVFLGKNVWITEQIFDSMYRKKESIFVKELSSALFGDDVLQKSSVTGTLSNRKKSSGESARPQLDPTKMIILQDVLRYKLEENKVNPEDVMKSIKNIGKIINEKIQDLRRHRKGSLKDDTSMTSNKNLELEQGEPTSLINSETQEECVP